MAYLWVPLRAINGVALCLNRCDVLLQGEGTPTDSTNEGDRQSMAARLGASHECAHYMYDSL